jgi:hypothetical protein
MVKVGKFQERSSVSVGMVGMFLSDSCGVFQERSSVRTSLLKLRSCVNKLNRMKPKAKHAPTKSNDLPNEVMADTPENRPSRAAGSNASTITNGSVTGPPPPVANNKKPGGLFGAAEAKASVRNLLNVIPSQSAVIPTNFIPVEAFRAGRLVERLEAPIASVYIYGMD